MAEKATVTEPKQTDVTFGIGMGEMVAKGWAGYRNNFVPVTLGAVVTFAVLGLTMYFALDLEDGWQRLFAVLGSLVATSASTLPWHRAALAAFDGEEGTVGRMFEGGLDLRRMIFASFFLWAAIQFGLRYTRGLLAILVVILYGFFGFYAADRPGLSGMKILGNSVLHSQGKKMGVAAVALTILGINGVGVLALLTLISLVVGDTGGEVTELTVVGWVLAVLMLIVTTSWSMVCGAAVFRALEKGSKS